MASNVEVTLIVVLLVLLLILSQLVQIFFIVPEISKNKAKEQIRKHSAREDHSTAQPTFRFTRFCNDTEREVFCEQNRDCQRVFCEASEFFDKETGAVCSRQAYLKDEPEVVEEGAFGFDVYFDDQRSIPLLVTSSPLTQRAHIYEMPQGSDDASPQLVQIIEPPSEVEFAGFFGYRIAVSGNLLVITDRFATIGGTALGGAAYVYRYNESASEWQFTEELKDPLEGARGQCGQSVAIIGEDTIAIGCRLGSSALVSGQVSLGKVVIFELNSTSSEWEVAQVLFSTDPRAFAFFGESIDMLEIESTNTSLLAVGCRRERSPQFPTVEEGAVFVFERVGGVGGGWSLREVVRSSHTGTPLAENSEFGTSLSLAQSGGGGGGGVVTLAVGAERYSPPGSNYVAVGQVSIYTARTNETFGFLQNIDAPNGGFPSGRFSGKVDLSENARRLAVGELYASRGGNYVNSDEDYSLYLAGAAYTYYRETAMDNFSLEDRVHAFNAGELEFCGADVDISNDLLFVHCRDSAKSEEEPLEKTRRASGSIHIYECPQEERASPTKLLDGIDYSCKSSPSVSETFAACDDGIDATINDRCFNGFCRGEFVAP